MAGGGAPPGMEANERMLGEMRGGQRHGPRRRRRLLRGPRSITMAVEEGSQGLSPAPAVGTSPTD